MNEENKQKVDAFRETVPKEIKDMYHSHKNGADFNGFYNMDYYFLGALEATQKLQKELETERKLNAEIKARFVKCNTCTDDMKSKCLMFSENLCGGERCEELVDLMDLVSKNECTQKIEHAKKIIKKFFKHISRTELVTAMGEHNVIEAEVFITE